MKESSVMENIITLEIKQEDIDVAIKEVQTCVWPKRPFELRCQCIVAQAVIRQFKLASTDYVSVAITYFYINNDFYTVDDKDRLVMMEFTDMDPQYFNSAKPNQFNIIKQN